MILVGICVVFAFVVICGLVGLGLSWCDLLIDGPDRWCETCGKELDPALSNPHRCRLI